MDLIVPDSGYLGEMCKPLLHWWNFFHTFKIEVFKNPENLVGNYHDDMSKKSQNEILDHLTDFRSILVRKLTEFQEICSENREFPHQNRPKIRQVVQNQNLTFFAHIIMVVYHQFFRVLKNFDFEGMKKIPQKRPWL